MNERLNPPLSGDPEIQRMIDALISPSRQKTWWNAAEIHGPGTLAQRAREALTQPISVPTATEFYAKYGAYGAEIFRASLRSTQRS